MAGSPSIAGGRYAMDGSCGPVNVFNVDSATMCREAISNFRDRGQRIGIAAATKQSAIRFGHRIQPCTSANRHDREV